MFAIITENDVSKWNDETGSVYHFPKRYLRFLQPETKVIYYKGVIRDNAFEHQRLSNKPHYFGIGTIGKIYDDTNSNKHDKFATIENYHRFEKPVFIKYAEGYIETISESRKFNYWRDGVRSIDKQTYDKIISLTEIQTQDEEDTDTSQVNDRSQSFESGFEGNKKQKYITTYERNQKLRSQAISIHGVTCVVCGTNFEELYGEHGKDYIHVHHIKPVSESDGAHIVNPEVDMTVLCPNCHAMVHRFRNKTLSVEELQQYFRRELSS